MLDLSLIDLIEKRHGTCPRTHTRSNNIPIDCCFGSPNLSISKGGFLSFRRLHSDHRGVWIDIPTQLLFGHKPPPVTYFGARKLKFIDQLKITKKIQRKHTMLEIYFTRWIIYIRELYFLFPHTWQKNTKNWTKKQKIYMEEAEDTCRKLHTGEVPWSPVYKKVCLILLYWYMTKDHSLGIHTNVRQLITLQNKIGL